jgi:hypothetical protein
MKANDERVSMDVTVTVTVQQHASYLSDWPTMGL